MRVAVDAKGHLPGGGQGRGRSRKIACFLCLGQMKGQCFQVGRARVPP